MQVLSDPSAMMADSRARRAAGQTIGFVPTMGFLHVGHTSLMALARPRCDWLVASIYVNPLQFAPTEDLDRYPRDMAGDLAKCEAAGVDLVFVPASLYPPDHATRVRVGGPAEGLESVSRPHFFEGVATVVARLFGLVKPTLAVFGEKDYQQLLTIRRMVEDLALDIEILGGPLIRDDDGVALSSRNAYLSDEQRRRARSLHQALYAVRDALAAGELDPDRLAEIGRQRLDVDRLDYLRLADDRSLTPLTAPHPGQQARALVAAWVGPTRLIDNVACRAPAG